MKPIRRCLFTFSAMVSLLLCLASTVFMIRGFFRLEYVDWGRLDSKNVVHLWRIQSDGRIALMIESHRTSNGQRPPVDQDDSSMAASIDAKPGISVRSIPFHQPVQYWQGRLRSSIWLSAYNHPYIDGGTYISSSPGVSLPPWMIAVPSAIHSTIWLVRRRRNRTRAVTGKCKQCGYDLRATPERCPECGGTANID